MSHTGKLTRGLHYWGMRNIDGGLPKGVTNDANKMKDLDYYKAFIKDKDEKEVNKVIIDRHNLTKVPGGRMSTKYKKLKDTLSNWPVKAETKSKGKK